MITKETIVRQLNSTSNEIALKLDTLYAEEISGIIEEMAHSYNLIYTLINQEDQSKISDADFQSAFLFWSALNTYLGALELFRRGYNKEPHMLLRNVIEIFSAAFDIHANPSKLTLLRNRPKDFDSKKSVNIVKSIHPQIQTMWGSLSGYFSHVSIFHTIPHETQAFCVGGLFDQDNQKVIIFSLLPLTLTLDILNSVLELSFIKKISQSRYWEKVSDDTYKFIHTKTATERAEKLMKKMDEYLKPK